ncbi:MAG: hypothetical protein RR643_04860 [Anaerorhabdus sp.]|uniref:hypothetical protein n=1 Tax=Anaerorhabdus sp. TaxID=1872524 RepID=UPI002FC748C6
MTGRQLAIENAKIGYKNFTGVEGKYNKEGERNFAVFLDDELTASLEQDGWNVKYPKDREFEPGEEDFRQPYLQVGVGFKSFPPKVVIVAGESTTVIGEEEISMLDWATILNVDLVLRPYTWTVNGKSGVKAYLKAIYVTIEVDQFRDKYGV